MESWVPSLTLSSAALTASTAGNAQNLNNLPGNRDTVSRPQTIIQKASGKKVFTIREQVGWIADGWLNNALQVNRQNQCGVKKVNDWWAKSLGMPREADSFPPLSLQHSSSAITTAQLYTWGHLFPFSFHKRVSSHPRPLEDKLQVGGLPWSNLLLPYPQDPVFRPAGCPPTPNQARSPTGFLWEDSALVTSTAIPTQECPLHFSPPIFILLHQATGAQWCRLLMTDSPPCPNPRAHDPLLSLNTTWALAGSLSCLLMHACQNAPISLKDPWSQGPFFKTSTMCGIQQVMSRHVHWMSKHSSRGVGKASPSLGTTDILAQPGQFPWLEAWTGLLAPTLLFLRAATFSNTNTKSQTRIDVMGLLRGTCLTRHVSQKKMNVLVYKRICPVPGKFPPQFRT